ncbi:MAG: fluoride efflux transporter CrcB [Gammaproteobacteria bacterium]|jgi:CrcB protein|nr:fluoride efflux transporter CrcB [Gammaproteobacteria bacterium]
MNKWVLIGLVAAGSALGGVWRYLLADLINIFVKGFPLATLTVNVLGSFLIGIFFVYCSRSMHQEILRAFLMVGLMGGFTTFSTFSLDILSLFEEGKALFAGLYMLASVSLSLLGAYWGITLMRLKGVG